MALYLLFPNQNPGSDAWGYAAIETKWTQPETQHFYPHHLLYHWFGHNTYALLPFRVMDFMSWMQCLNAISGGLSLFFFYRICKLIFEQNTALLVAFLAGSTFGFLRFLNENETYIIPLALGLCGSFMLMKREQGLKFIYSGFFMLALAALFHQIHIWWWLAAIITVGFNKKAYPAAILSLLFIIGSYVIAANMEEKYWLSFPFSDAMQGTVQLLPDLNNFKFTAVNLLRTFVQIHGNILFFIKCNVFLAVMAAMGLLMIGFGIFQKPKNEPGKILEQTNKESMHFFRLAGMLQLLWAFYSVGNAEFMVMLPFLGILSFPNLIHRNHSKLLGLGVGILLWNLSVYCIPHYMYHLSVPDKMLETARNLSQYNKPVYYISREKVLLENFADAKGMDLKQMKLVLLSAPSERGSHTTDQPQLDTLIARKHLVISDCKEFPEPLSRSSVMAGNKNDDFFKPYNAEKVAVIPGFYGEIQFHRISAHK